MKHAPTNHGPTFATLLLVCAVCSTATQVIASGNPNLPAPPPGPYMTIDAGHVQTGGPGGPAPASSGQEQGASAAQGAPWQAGQFPAPPEPMRPWTPPAAVPAPGWGHWPRSPRQGAEPPVRGGYPEYAEPPTQWASPPAYGMDETDQPPVDRPPAYGWTQPETEQRETYPGYAPGYPPAGYYAPPPPVPGYYYAPPAYPPAYPPAGRGGPWPPYWR
jgi:hypothetical protein